MISSNDKRKLTSYKTAHNTGDHVVGVTAKWSRRRAAAALLPQMNLNRRGEERTKTTRSIRVALVSALLSSAPLSQESSAERDDTFGLRLAAQSCRLSCTFQRIQTSSGCWAEGTEDAHWQAHREHCVRNFRLVWEKVLFTEMGIIPKWTNRKTT